MLAFLLISVGLVALVAGAELLVRGASRMAAAVGVSPLIVGLTVVAFGTSAPELAVSVSASLAGQPDIAVGNVVGSNIFNVLLILGLSALIIPLVVDQKLIRFDVPLMIVISLAVWGFGVDGRIGRVEGSLLFAGLLSYMVWCVTAARRESAAVKQEYENAFRGDGALPLSEPSRVGVKSLLWQVLLIAAGLVLLVVGAGWLVDGATQIARRMGVSELVIGLTIIAGGTSLPEVATSIVAAVRGERDIAVGNVVGSNLFNMLGVLGLSAAVAPEGLPVAGQALQFDIPVMVVATAACLPIFFTGHLIARWEGALFFGYFLAYTTTLVLIATGSQMLPVFQLLMFGFVVPLTLITLLIGVVRAIHRWRWQTARVRLLEQASPCRILVIGGGFGGLAAVQGLAGVPVHVTLVDRRNFHLFQPLLYQVATGSLSPANIAAPLRRLLWRQWNADVHMADVQDIDLKQRVVRTADARELPYNLLVVAAGVRHSYFGHPEWESAAPGLKTIEDATEIRGRILAAFEAAENAQNQTQRQQLLTFVIVGGGPTGVELAGSLAEIAKFTLENEFRSINPSDARIVLIEAADRLLTMYPEKLSARARVSLERLGVVVRCRTRVVSVEPEQLTLAGDEAEELLPARTILWAAGVAASPLARSLAEQSGAETDHAGRVKVQPDLTLPGFPEVFVIGDMIDCRGPDGQPVPGIAPAAIQQGSYVAAEIRRRLSSSDGAASTAPAMFRYRPMGNLATIGRSAAVAHLGWLKISGFPAWLLWLLIHIAKLSQFENRVLVFVQWLWSFVTFGRSARLITGRPTQVVSLPVEHSPTTTTEPGA